MHFYLQTIEDAPVNLSRIANSGQMFRWKEIEGGWQANDGSSQYDIVQLGETTFDPLNSRSALKATPEFQQLMATNK